jgi:predicted GNAT family N-acyltransferase
VIEFVDRDRILPLRHAVLRPGLPLSTAMYPEDDTPDIFHLGDVAGDGSLVCCATFFPAPLESIPGWRLRGMATQPGHRNAGVGGRVLEAGVAEIVRRGGEMLWCKGRVAAGSFYLRHGFSTRGEEFAEPPVNAPNIIFVRVLAPAAQLVAGGAVDL